ncbi:MAG: hypothetical protein HUK23_06075 [Sphaerochaetaceae bacterium]|nr:hypothetical protein [Sphaerochaetaceae bacterium]
MTTIIHTSDCQKQAQNLAKVLEQCSLISVQEVLQNPVLLESFDQLGFIYSNQGKTIPQEISFLIKDVLSLKDLSSLNYLFNLCVCEKNSGYALKLVEILCSNIGCAPSLSMELKSDTDYQTIAQKIKNNDIVVAGNTFGAWLYSKLHKIR